MDAIPCPLCGYDAPGPTCPHCRRKPAEKSLAAPLRGRITGIGVGLRAVPEGLALLFRTSGIKHLLIPPLFLTLLAFTLIFYEVWGYFGELLTAVRIDDPAALDWDIGWLRKAAEWIIRARILVWIANLSQVLLFIFASGIIAAWTFAIVYEALAGPFLDEIQGRLEERWFGQNPRNTIERPTAIPVARCARLSTIAGIPAGVALLFFVFVSGWPAWIALAAAPVPFLALAAYDKEYGKWLAWVVRVEGRTLWVSIKAACLAGVVLILFFWLKFIPLIGPPLFFAVAGFTTALSLLDIPFSRRQWSLRRRLLFMGQNALPLTAFGAVAALVFLVPVIGALVMVPAASIGGLWLVCRLDKDALRPPDLRFGKRPAA